MAPATHRAVRGATNLLTATPGKAAIITACALASARDLPSLARACLPALRDHTVGEGACDDGRGLEDTPVRLKLYMVTIGLSILACRRVRMTSVRAAAAGL